MQKTLAIVYAPAATESQVRMLTRKLRYYLDRYGLSRATIKINPKLPLRFNQSEKVWNILVLGWGLPSEPAWDRWVYQNNLGRVAREFLAFDLFERRGFNGSNLNEPKINAGKYWSQKIQRNNLQLFLDGYYLKSVAPYGMKCVSKKETRENHNASRTHFILELGDPAEGEIVRLIFDLFVNHDYSRQRISNLLTAQSVRPPRRNVKWRGKIVKGILEDPVYIGANEYHANIRFDVFPSLIDKAIFFEAQAKIMREPITRKDVQAMNRNYESSSLLGR